MIAERSGFVNQEARLLVHREQRVVRAVGAIEEKRASGGDGKGHESVEQADVLAPCLASGRRIERGDIAVLAHGEDAAAVVGDFDEVASRRFEGGGLPDSGATSRIERVQNRIRIAGILRDHEHASVGDERVRNGARERMLPFRHRPEREPRCRLKSGVRDVDLERDRLARLWLNVEVGCGIRKRIGWNDHGRRQRLVVRVRHVGGCGVRYVGPRIEGTIR